MLPVIDEELITRYEAMFAAAVSDVLREDEMPAHDRTPGAFVPYSVCMWDTAENDESRSGAK